MAIEEAPASDLEQPAPGPPAPEQPALGPPAPEQPAPGPPAPEQPAPGPLVPEQPALGPPALNHENDAGKILKIVVFK